MLNAAVCFNISIPVLEPGWNLPGLGIISAPGFNRNYNFIEKEITMAQSGMLLKYKNKFMYEF